MKIKTLLTAIAVAELAAGVGFLIVPAIVVELLFGQPPDSEVALVVGRLTGLALITIGLICWLEKSNNRGGSPDSLLVGLLLYNGAVPVLLICGYLVYGIGGIVLWPAVILHLAFAAWLTACLRRGRVTR